MRRNTGNIMVRRAIIAAMIGMLTAGLPMNVRAQEEIPVTTEAVTDEQTESGENASVQSAPVSLTIQSAQVSSTPAYADAVAEGAASDAETAADNANAAADDASSVIASLPDSVDTAAEASSAATAVSEYNAGVNKADAELSAASAAASKAETKASEASNLASSAAGVCTSEANVAESQLALALAVDSTSPTQEVKDAVEAVKKAADAANTAYQTAKTSYVSANANLIKAIAEYNMIASLYNKALIDTTQLSAYDQASYSAALDAARISYTGVGKGEVQNAENILKQETDDNKATEDLMLDIQKVQNADLGKAGQAVQDAKSDYDVASKSLKAAEAAVNIQPSETEKKTYYEKLDARVAAAGTEVTKAQDDYDARKNELQGLQNILQNVSLSTLDYQAVRDEIEQAQKAVAAAKTELDQAKAARDEAVNYKNWAESLINVDSEDSSKMKLTTGTFSQVDTDKQLIVDSKLYAFDETDDEVVSHNEKFFTSVAGTSEKVEIPYSIYRAYVKAMYGKAIYTSLPGGKGVTLDTGNEVIYWAVDANNKLTGTYYIGSSSSMPSGTYFVGYTLKHESNGYHIDGILKTYTAVTPGPTPNPTPNPTPATTASVASATVEDVATPLAATPQVLGVSRPAPAVTTPAVQEQPQVLGATRSRATGDETHDGLRMIIALAGASAAGILALGAKRRKKQDRKEQ